MMAFTNSQRYSNIYIRVVKTILKSIIPNNRYKATTTLELKKRKGLTVNVGQKLQLNKSF